MAVGLKIDNNIEAYKDGFVYIETTGNSPIGKIPDELKFTATSNGISDSFIEEVPPIPGLGSNGVLFGNVGFGLSF